MRSRSIVFVAALFCSLAVAQSLPHLPWRRNSLQRSLRDISPERLRGNLSFLSSDALKGRWTPSPELDVAAEFIASRFRAAGIAPGNGGSYFQDADLASLAARDSEDDDDLKTGRPIQGRNVIAVLPGVDPKLRNTYLVVSAHYDHIGTLSTAGRRTHDKVAKNGDVIFNGANDDGSGTVSIIEIAAALAKAKYHPKRTLVFILFCGEELGELGSQYYIKHPVYPLRNTVADINLEQVGRSDSDFGKGRASLTGYRYTSMMGLFQNAARHSGFNMVETKGSDAYFEQSDNYSFALAGIPDLTFATSFNFPDYHGLKDEWTKIDFPDLARADRLVMRVVLQVAGSKELPHWEVSNPKTGKYRQAEAARKAASGTT